MVFVVCMSKRGPDESGDTVPTKKTHTTDEHRLQNYGTTLFFESVKEFYEILKIKIPSTKECLQRKNIVKTFCETEEFDFNNLHMTHVNSGGRCSDMLLSHMCSKSCNPDFLPRMYRPMINDVEDKHLLSEAIGRWVAETKPESVTTNKRSCLIISVTVFVDATEKTTIGHELFLYWDVFDGQKKCGYCDNLDETHYHQGEERFHELLCETMEQYLPGFTNENILNCLPSDSLTTSSGLDIDYQCMSLCRRGVIYASFLQNLKLLSEKDVLEKQTTNVPHILINIFLNKEQQKRLNFTDAERRYAYHFLNYVFIMFKMLKFFAESPLIWDKSNPKAVLWSYSSEYCKLDKTYNLMLAHPSQKLATVYYCSFSGDVFQTTSSKDNCTVSSPFWTKLENLLELFQASCAI
jgi:hypothetical protein